MLGPESAHSPNAEDLNSLYWVLLAISTILVVAINAALIAMIVRYRGERGREARRLRTRRRFQFLVAGGFGVLALLIFVIGIIHTERASDVEPSGPNGLEASSARFAQRGIEAPPASDSDTEPLVVEAAGQQWLWRYEYPDGTYSYYELVVPVDTTVMVKLVSTDVVHRWSVPGLGGKFDAVPSQSNATWFRADEEGTYYGTSYQFSGASYAAMRTEVRVVSVQEYQAWLEEQAADIQEAQDFVAEENQIRGEPGTEAGSENIQAPPEEGQQ